MALSARVGSTAGGGLSARAGASMAPSAVGGSTTGGGLVLLDLLVVVPVERLRLGGLVLLPAGFASLAGFAFLLADLLTGGFCAGGFGFAAVATAGVVVRCLPRDLVVIPGGAVGFAAFAAACAFACWLFVCMVLLERILLVKGLYNGPTIHVTSTCRVSPTITREGRTG